MPIITEIEEHQKMPKNIGQFFAHKNVFITGGTGFLGTVLVESLLSCSPDIGVIYILVREKFGYNPHERISRMLSKPIFSKHNESTLQKVVPIVGELSALNLGFKDDLMEELIGKVNIIYHSAATIRFRTSLRTAIKTNLTGTLRTIEFAKRLKKLTAYVYLSTAFCNSNNRGYIEERIYKSHYDPYEMIKMAEDDDAWTNFTVEKTKDYIRDHPNTYTFTKNLAENLIAREMPGLPAGIVRPSIIYGTLENPTRGWVGGATSGHLGFLAGFLKGIFRTVTGSPSATIDIVPCDYVVNASLVMGWYVGTRKLEKPELIHCTSGEVNPLTLEEFVGILNHVTTAHPSDRPVFLPKAKLRNGLRYKLFFYIFQVIPAIIITIPEKLFGVGMTHHSVYEYMTVFDRGTKAFQYFLDKDFKYSLKNALKIMDQLPEEDVERYNYDCSKCDWTEFMARCIIGIRHYYFKESPETTKRHNLSRLLLTVLTIVYRFATFAVPFLIGMYLFGSIPSFFFALFIALFLLWL